MPADTPHTTPKLDPLDIPIWGAQQIAAYLHRSSTQVYRLLQAGRIDATKLGELWTTTPRRLRRSLGIEAG
jgi:excisionase family DNA binding protein